MGEDISILNFAKLIKLITGFEGQIILDKSKRDGTPRKLMDVSRLKDFGCEAKIDLNEGIKKVHMEVQNCTCA